MSNERVTPRSTSRKKRDELINHGQRMSNVLYNMAQAQGVPDDYKRMAKALCDEWDKIRRKP